MAEGLMLVQHIRDREMLQALRERDGLAIAVADEKILHDRKELAQIGLYVEPTSAAVDAALVCLRLGGVTIATFT